jgi:hypothetical protein
MKRKWYNIMIGDLVDFMMGKAGLEIDPKKEKISRELGRIEGIVEDTKFGRVITTNNEDYLVENMPDETVGKKISIRNAKIYKIKVFNKNKPEEKKLKVIKL